MNTDFNINQTRTAEDHILPYINIAAYIGAGIIVAKHAIPAVMAALLHVRAAYTQKLNYKSKTTWLQSVEMRCIKQAKKNLKRDVAIVTALTTVGFATGLLKSNLSAAREKAEAAALKLAREYARDNDSVISNLYDLHFFKAGHKSLSIISNYFFATQEPTAFSFDKSLLDCGPNCWEKVERVNLMAQDFALNYVIEPMTFTASIVYSVVRLPFPLQRNPKGKFNSKIAKSMLSYAQGNHTTSVLSSGLKFTLSKASDTWKWVTEASNSVKSDHDKIASITTLMVLSTLLNRAACKAGLGPKQIIRTLFLTSFVAANFEIALEMLQHLHDSIIKKNE